jgi:hypothetical protein
MDRLLACLLVLGCASPEQPGDPPSPSQTMSLDASAPHAPPPDASLLDDLGALEPSSVASPGLIRVLFVERDSAVPFDSLPPPADLTQLPDLTSPADLTPPPYCHDGRLDGDESDVDCGGPSCPPCGLAQHCFVGTDCALYGLCVCGVCSYSAVQRHGICDHFGATCADCGTCIACDYAPGLARCGGGC